MNGACILWQGAVQSRGYGAVTNGKGGTVLAHRKAWEDVNGAIPDGMTIDHLCNTKTCVNTGHMEVVTRAENSRRKIARQTHCKRNHPLSGENLRIKVRADGTVNRICRVCARMLNEASRLRVESRWMSEAV